MMIRFAVWPAGDAFAGKILGKTPRLVAGTEQECMRRCVEMIYKLLVDAKFSSHGLRDSILCPTFLPREAKVFEIDSNWIAERVQAAAKAEKLRRTNEALAGN